MPLIKLRQSDPIHLRCMQLFRPFLFPMYTEESSGVDSHMENSLERYIKYHDHHYLRRTIGEHVGNINTSILKAQLEDIMIEGISQEVSQEKPK